MSFYRLKQFQCEVTGRSGLDYFQAVESEKQEARTMHARFSEQLKPAILKAVQWRMSLVTIFLSLFPFPFVLVLSLTLLLLLEVVGRLDHLVEAVYERFKDRYFKGESMLYHLIFIILSNIKNVEVLIDLSLGKGLGSSENGGKYYAEVAKVYPPSYNADQEARDAHKGSLDDPDSELPHAISGDLNEAAKDANARDDPHLYYYWVSILEPEKEKGAAKTAASKSVDSDGTVVGSLMEVQCPMMR
jgi:bromodomain adjacent to zinc finger domain protein 1A